MLTWLVWQGLVWLANHWLQLVGVAAIIIVIRALLSINEKLGQVFSSTGLNDWRLRNEVDAVKNSISRLWITSNNASENLCSRIWEVRNEIAELKRLLEDGLFVYGVDEHERRRQARLDHHVQNSHQKAEAGDLSAQAHYAELLAIQGDYVQAYMWLDIAVTRADKHPARFFRASAIDRRDKIAADMTSEQIGEAKQKAFNWLARHTVFDSGGA